MSDRLLAKLKNIDFPRPIPAETLNKNKIRGILSLIRFYQNNYLIGMLEGNLAIKGNMLSPQVGMEYELAGSWESNSRWGDTFVFTDYKASYPKNLNAIRYYLMENAKWIGPEISGKLVDIFGENTLRVCKDDPERVAGEISGITLERARKISAMLRNNEAKEELQLQIKTLLAGTRISKRAINKLLELYGDHAPEVLRDNPYKLIDEIDGIGFVTADEIARRAGFAREGKPRLLAGLFHVLKVNARGQGHTCLPQNNLLSEAEKLLSVEKPILAKILNEAIKEKLLIEYKEHIYLPGFFEDEKLIATKLHVLMGY